MDNWTDLGLGDTSGEVASDILELPRLPMETVNLRIPSDQLARLDLLLANIRGRAGIFVGRSGAVRALINWLAQSNVGIQGIRTGADMEHRLMRLLSPSSDGGDSAANVEISIRGTNQIDPPW